jgi:hypothetical protein
MKVDFYELVMGKKFIIDWLLNGFLENRCNDLLKLKGTPLDFFFGNFVVELLEHVGIWEKVNFG